MEIVVVVTVILALSLSLQQGSAQMNCQDAALTGLLPCLAFTRDSSSAPTPECCSGLKKVMQNQPQCLCEVAGNNSNVNKTQAMELPTACHVQTPPAFSCNSPPGPARAGHSSSSFSPLLAAATLWAGILAFVSVAVI